MDGTLVDTAELHFQAWSATAAAMGQPFTRADFAATFGKRNPEIIRQLFGTAYSDKEIADWGYRKEEHYNSAARHGVDLLPGVRTLLEGIHAAGFKQAIGSSAPRGNLDLIISITGTQPTLFGTVVAMGDLP
jgi:beta-phosphoglucomutase